MQPLVWNLPRVRPGLFLGLVYLAATFAARLLPMVIPTQAGQVFQGVWPARYDVVHISGWFGTTASG